MAWGTCRKHDWSSCFPESSIFDSKSSNTSYKQSLKNVDRTLPVRGGSFWMRSWATWTRFLSSWRHFWNFLLFSSSRRSKSMAASSKAWINPFQDFRAGTWGTTAALMPVPITSTSSRGFLVFRLGSSFLGFLVGGAPSLKNPQILPVSEAWLLWKPSSFCSTLFYAIRLRGAGYKPNCTNSSGDLHARQ